MALLTNPADGNLEGVHALLIGVGKYPHLLDGASNIRFAHCAEMGQLTSPYHSVKKFKDWLQTNGKLAGKPLRSLRVLASSPKPVANLGFGVPTLANIRKMTHEWIGDCGKHRENVALFYFCGHGLEHGGCTALLAQDFGSDSISPFAHSFDPNLLVSAALAYKASKQLFLVDACRGNPDEVKDRYKRITPVSLVDHLEHSNTGLTKQSHIRATELTKSAFGVENGPSVFMTALLDSMRGAGALQQPHGQWVVNTSTLRQGIDSLVKRDHGEIQSVAFDGLSSDFLVHEIGGTPAIPVDVTVTPESSLSALRLSTDCGKVRNKNSSTPWRVEVDPGNREFYAGSVTNPKKHIKADLVTPPRRVVTIPCGD